jgi:hypothetical protein
MELGQYQLQIFVSLVVILVAFVALICDFLRSNNEQLRELAIELKARLEEEQRRSQMMTAHTISSTAPAARAMAARAPEREKEPKRPPSPAALAAMERGAQLAASPRGRAAAQHSQCEVAPPEIQATHVEENVAEIVRTPSVQPAAAASIVKQATLVAKHGVANHINGASKKDWGSLLARKPAKSMQPDDARPVIEISEDLPFAA